MKKMFLAVMMIAVSAFADAPRQFSVTPTSQKIVSPRFNYLQSAPLWTTNVAYAQGAMVNASNKIYMVTVAGGTSTNMPTHLNGTYSTNGLSYLFVPHASRGMCRIYNGGAAEIWLSFGDDIAVYSNGVHLAAATEIDVPAFLLQQPINAVSNPTKTNVVAIQEL